ncbi:Rha family transcriptional regulator [Methylobacillus flagellatus]|uniref:Rha family transcriptional regulator n=1 Tax=Methylobacillus flagellatus TaxID=405 RepID=UPI002854124B|nr:Rha family transcriptional regulator [Methylobacillus flagellatus]MDR5171576.1 Rha family transcriptional regulator [Methylobacillus flagellatus]
MNHQPLIHIQIKSEPRIDSRLIADSLGVKHQNTYELIKDYKSDFEQLGIIRFQTGEIKGRGQPGRYAMLNEDQAYLLLTYSRNTAKVRALKVKLVQAFRDARKALESHQTEYLPGYHAMHDELAHLDANSRHIHMNFNRLVNKAVGIGAGERSSLPFPHKSMLVAAQFIAASAAHSASNSKEAYQKAKDALRALVPPAARLVMQEGK